MQGCDFILLPCGFSYGDYLRSGAISRFSPIMQEVIQHDSRGGNVFGMMPHLERAVDPELGNTDGRAIFASILELVNA